MSETTVEVKGTVEIRAKSGNGIKLNGKWYNSSTKHEYPTPFENINKGDSVTLRATDRGFVTEFSVDGKGAYPEVYKPSANQSTQSYTPPPNTARDLAIAKAVVVKAVFDSPLSAWFVSKAETTIDGVTIMRKITESVEEYLFSQDPAKSFAETLLHLQELFTEKQAEGVSNGTSKRK